MTPNDLAAIEGALSTPIKNADVVLGRLLVAIYNYISAQTTSINTNTSDIATLTTALAALTDRVTALETP